jgi:hypothetical protein
MKPANSLGIIGRLGDRVFQRVAPGLGNIQGDASRTLQNRAYVKPTDRHTPAQLAQRMKMRDAVASWHTIDPDLKATYRARAKPLNMTGFNLYISTYLRSV